MHLIWVELRKPKLLGHVTCECNGQYKRTKFKSILECTHGCDGLILQLCRCQHLLFRTSLTSLRALSSQDRVGNVIQSRATSVDKATPPQWLRISQSGGPI
eukprot:3026728-Amphidinium_carterae.1